MNKLIKITEKNGKKIVNARELYKFLSLSPSNFGRWIKRNVLDATFLQENKDWGAICFKFNNINKSDFWITFEVALTLISKSTRKKPIELKKYFTESKKVESPQKIAPKSYVEALETLIKLEKEKELHELQTEKAIEALDQIYEIIKNIKEVL